MSSRSSRASARLAKSSTGATITAPETQGVMVQHEEGQLLDEVDQANAEIAIGEGNTALVTNDHWSDKLSLEMKAFADKFEAFGTGLSKKKKQEFDELLEEFKGAAAKEREDAPSSSIDTSTDKHERMVATKGANAHMAAVTQGKSILEADAEMAVAMGNLEGKQAEFFARKIKEMEALQAQALKNQATAHKKEVTSKVKDASEKATAAAEQRYTRARGEKASAAAADVEMVDKAFHSPAPTTTGGTVPASPAQSIDALLPKAALNGPLGEQLRAMGANLGEAPKPDKKDGKRKAENGEAGDEGDKPKRGKPKKPKYNDDGSEMTKADEESARRKAASECYAELNIRGPSGLPGLVDRFHELEEKEEQFDALKEKLAKREEQLGQYKENRKILNRRLKKAVKALKDAEWTDVHLKEAQIISDDEE